MYQKIGSKFKRKYGFNVEELALKLNCSTGSIINWENQGLDIFLKSRNCRLFRGNTKLLHCWHNMISRCCNIKDKKFSVYGGRGIKVFITKEQFISLWDRDRADLMISPSFDRKNPDGNYEINNCRFIEKILNTKTRRPHIKHG